MARTFGEVKARVRALLDDPSGSYLTDSFIDPIVNEVYSDINSQLTSTQSSYDIAVIEVPGVTPGTPNLSYVQGPGQLLGGLASQPERIDWKVAGNDPSYYSLVTNYNVLPDVQPQQGISGWEYRAGVIWLTRCSILVDIRVRGEFIFPPLVKDDDVLQGHDRLGYVVAYGTASLIGAIRGNQAWAASYDAKATEGLDDIMGELVRAEQGQVRRIGRQTQNGRWGRNVPNATM
ncbi:MAG: hypothetical protein KGL39_35630 [Patescibacteria group bacterium]|nr:hypothetical protein [Patescibacteria group bacterium]